MQSMIQNPILPGFYPDPSICRVGADFYLITSSFSLYPGVPIFHSTDLMNWVQIGNVLDRPSQLHVTADHLAGGIMAPTIRYHDGMFYIINTNFSSKGNFIVTATDPAGPWSDPIWLPDVLGIDPSLFFDDDGRCYISGTRRQTKPDGLQGSQVIWMAELDLSRMCLISEPVDIWGGALVNAPYPEAPHLYRRNGWYYLVIAEGGTEHFHAVTIARSQTLNTWFEGYKGNPVLTHRHLGKLAPIGNPGHADLVETPAGDWYAVLLASRLVDGFYKNLGRESYIVPVIWEDNWPVFSPGTGKVEWTYAAPDLPASPKANIPVREDFDNEKLAMDWVFFGTPYEDFWKIADSQLALKLLPRAMSQELQPMQRRSVESDPTVPSLAFIGKRQIDIDYAVRTRINFTAASENETAGLAIVQASNHQLRFERTAIGGRQIVRVVLATCAYDIMPHMPNFKGQTTETVLAAADVPDTELVLEIRQNGQDVGFYFGSDENALKLLADQVDCRQINPEKVGGMIGTCVGMFASANGEKSDNSASFAYFDYQALT